MSAIVLMKAFERSPSRYDFGMRLATFGCIDRVLDAIADSVLHQFDVLDIGSGTGKLSALLAKRGARVIAIDKSPEMVSLASERIVKGGFCKSVSTDQKTVMEADRLFEPAQFDAVILSLVMSELTPDERNWVLDQCERVLRPSGFLLLADEFVPKPLFKKIAFHTLRFPLHLAAYLYTQIKGLYTSNLWWKLYYSIVELPLMLISFFVSEPLTRPLKQIENILPSGLRIAEAVDFGLIGSTRLLKIEKVRRLTERF